MLLAAGSLFADASSFQIVSKNKSVPILIDQSDAKVVGISATAFAKDVNLITELTPDILYRPKSDGKAVLVFGTIGQSKLIDHLIETGKIEASSIAGKWESFLIQVVEQPGEGTDRALVVAGSDPRGTAFGIFELSKRLGVSPWVYWADVLPAKTKELSITLDRVVVGPPAVKFRGIFLNDEDWWLQPWAANNIDTDIKDIGPKTYARIFELLLRLKANYIWPAMHKCTKAFSYYPENQDVAAQYQIVIGSSHCEPMLRNNVDEWKNNFVTEYGKEPGPWRYDINQDQIYTYWNDRVKQVADKGIDAVYTVGMRGIHDGSMPGPKDQQGKIELLSQVVEDQRVILKNNLKKPISEIPQIFCPYKEVLELYLAGARIPDDVTLVWADDNYGFIRKLSNPEEQQRSGGSGVYYHLSYLGNPGSYLWLSTTSPSLISYEMSKAYAYGADRLWVFNVGDIKPAEMEMEFSMDLAWNPTAWTPQKAESYAYHWAAETFGKEYAAEIAEIKREYYQLSAGGKPEFLRKITFAAWESDERLALCQSMTEKAEKLQKRIPQHLQDAYFQLILYPVVSAAKINEKHIYADRGDREKSMQTLQVNKKLAAAYNNTIANGKWHVMADEDLESANWFAYRPIKIADKNDLRSEAPTPVKVLSADDLKIGSDALQIIPGLGISGKSLTLSDIKSSGYPDAESAPKATYQLELPAGSRKIRVLCLPTHSVYEGRGLRLGVSLGQNPFTIVDINTEAESDVWKENVLRRYSEAEFVVDLKKEEMATTLKIAILDPALAVSRIEIY